MYPRVVNPPTEQNGFFRPTREASKMDCTDFSAFKFQSLSVQNFPLVRYLDDDKVPVSYDQVTKLTPDAEGQVFWGTGEVAFQAEEFIDVVVRLSIFGGREEVRVVHREANPFWIFAILWNTGDRHFDGDMLATMVKHVGMGEKG
ncbi:hypothetical protein TNCV_2995191 [Trichonephila clavipes]|nr:hypothetical protein TNCV_2995191 [Trichonephila clavipes]